MPNSTRDGRAEYGKRTAYRYTSARVLCMILLYLYNTLGAHIHNKCVRCIRRDSASRISPHSAEHSATHVVLHAIAFLFSSGSAYHAIIRSQHSFRTHQNNYSFHCGWCMISILYVRLYNVYDMLLCGQCGRQGEAECKKTPKNVCQQHTYS